MDRNASKPFTTDEADLVMVEDDSADPRRIRSLPLHKVLATPFPSAVLWRDNVHDGSVGIAGSADRAADGDLLFSAIATENAFFNIQVGHQALIGASIKPHIHWHKTTDASGDVVFQIRYRQFRLDEVVDAWSSWLDVVARSTTLSDDQRHMEEEFAFIDMSGTTVDTVVEIEIQRDHDHVDDTYAADVSLMSMDIHFRVSRLGTPSI